MLRRVLQFLVRKAPNAAKFAWNALPQLVRRAAAPLVYPIAAGDRSGGRVLVVPADGIYAAFDVLYDPGLLPAARAAALAAGRRSFAIAPDEDPIAVANRHCVVDAVVVCRDDDTRLGAFRRLGFRWLPHSAEDVAAVYPSVSVVIATYDNRNLCESCLNALARNTAWPRLEIIVVDNGSRDGTGAMLARIAARDRRVNVIGNTDNAGFAAGTNQGLAIASGEYVVLLNDDTVVAPGWLARLVAHLEADSTLAIVCPVTNQIGNAAKIETTYRTLEEMEEFAAARALSHAGERVAIDVIALFCAAARRRVLHSVGFLDERYEIGLFEDDDLARTLSERGYRFAVAHDAFVHHVGQASFSKMTDAQYLRIWQDNKRRFEQKWGTTWTPPA